MYMGLLWSLFLIEHVYWSGICGTLMKRRTQIYSIKNWTGKKEVNLAKKCVKI